MELVVEPGMAGVAVVRPRGRLDLLVAAELKQALTAAVSAGQPRLVVDLGEVTFVDSSGLGALIGGLKAARLAGGDLRLARPTEQATFILELTALTRVLRPYGT